ncbi:MAG: acyl-CoA dehydrogenase family protein [Vicinamibacteraceae bacterium]|nr:acyl-CoA dehydrogenase family protein [Vicinamibacteraceae bacterium]
MFLEPTQAQTEFRERVEAFAREHVAPQAAAIDERNEFPLALVKQAGELGLLGVTVAEVWGGAGRDYVAYALAVETVARASATVGAILTVQNSLVAEAIAEFGTDQQKDRWLRALATGRSIGAFALSEEEAGSDAANQQTLATFDGEGYRLNGRKVWVANAIAADVAIVFAANHSDVRGREISAFLVPLDSPGLVRTHRDDSLGVRGLGCVDLDLVDVAVDSSQMLGAAGQGFGVARWALEGGRIAIAAQALGVGQAAVDEALAYARRRKTFGQPIANYQAVQWMLADMATELDAARMLTYKAAALKGRQATVATEAAMAKLAASEAAHKAADKAMQILASAGYRRGSTVERLFRDSRAAEIYQGTSEVQRMIIAEAVVAGQ